MKGHEHINERISREQDAVNSAQRLLPLQAKETLEGAGCNDQAGTDNIKAVEKAVAVIHVAKQRVGLSVFFLKSLEAKSTKVEIH